MISHDGKIYARVSEIIKPFVDFSHIDPEVLNRKAALGTRIHGAIHQEIRGEMSVAHPHEVGYLQSWLKWRDKLSPRFHASELRLFDHEKMITGCIDAAISFDESPLLILCDWKTAASESAVSWPMQFHLYRYLLEKNGYQMAPKSFFVRLDRNGGLPSVHVYRFCEKTMDKCVEAIDDFWKINDQTLAINSL